MPPLGDLIKISLVKGLKDTSERRPLETYRVHRVTCYDHDDGHGLVNEGQWAMFELPCEDTLRVHVGQLLDLQRPLEASGVVVAAPHDEQGLLLVELLRKLFDLAIHGENFLDLLCKKFESILIKLIVLTKNSLILVFVIFHPALCHQIYIL